jgi:hypothetical protein
VLGIQVQASPLCGLLCCSLQQLARRVTKELRYVHLFCLPPWRRSSTTYWDTARAFVKEPVKEIVEEAAAPPDG